MRYKIKFKFLKLSTERDLMKAILIKPIKMQDFDKQYITIPEDSEIYVDVIEGIAFYNGIHFYIDKSEYSTMN